LREDLFDDFLEVRAIRGVVNLLEAAMSLRTYCTDTLDQRFELKKITIVFPLDR